jgi:predicted nucleic acid-binding protein
MIAGIVQARQTTLATRNVSHFDDIASRLINPWTASD